LFCGYEKIEEMRRLRGEKNDGKRDIVLKILEDSKTQTRYVTKIKIKIKI
jgi:hypothetical protein